MPRVFFALWPDETVRTALAGIAADVELCSGRPAIPANFHITLAFLGNVDAGDLDRARRAADEIAADRFTLILDRCGWWHGPGVAWLAPSGEAPMLLDLVDKLRLALQGARLPVEHRAFKPHLTIARKVTVRPLLGKPFRIVWPINEFALVESRDTGSGVRYLALVSWPLREPAS